MDPIPDNILDQEEELSPASTALLARLMAPAPVPYRHPLSTEECPELVEFFLGLRQGWSERGRQHITGCEHCQGLMAKFWLDDAPPLSVLARYFAEPESHPDRRAVERYLAESGRRAEALMRRLVAGRREARKSLDTVRAWFRPLPEPALALASAASTPAAEILIEEVDAASRCSFGLRCTAAGDLEAFMLRDAGPTSSRFVMTVFGGAEELSVPFTLAVGESGAVVLGASGALLPSIGPDCLIVLEQLA